MGLSPVLTLWARAGRQLLAAYYRWALRDLQSKNPLHADIPEIVLAIRRNA